MTAVLVMIGLGAFLEADSDRIDMDPEQDGADAANEGSA
jgi:multicomponent K+:H+ antiporter subunit C